MNLWASRDDMADDIEFWHDEPSYDAGVYSGNEIVTVLPAVRLEDLGLYVEPGEKRRVKVRW